MSLRAIRAGQHGAGAAGARGHQSPALIAKTILRSRVRTGLCVLLLAAVVCG
jgi:hypothetical protein